MSIRHLLRLVLLVLTVLLAVACDLPDLDRETCYSPRQNIYNIDDEGSMGCACQPGDQAVCASYENGTALVCEDGYWKAVHDSRCAPPSEWNAS